MRKQSTRYDSISRWAGMYGSSESHLVSGFEVRKKEGSFFLKSIAKWCNSLTFSGFLGIGPSTSRSRTSQKRTESLWRKIRSVTMLGFSDSDRPTGILLNRSTGIVQSNGGVTVHCFRSMNIGRPSGMAMKLQLSTPNRLIEEYRCQTYLSQTTRFIQMVFFS